MKRVLQITTDFGQGGAERVFNQLSMDLSTNFELYDCVFNQNRSNVYGKHNKLLDLNVPSSRAFPAKVYNFLLRVIRLSKLKKKYQIEVSLSHLEGADYVNILSKSKDKVILCIHGSKLYDQEIKGIIGWIRLKFLLPLLYNRADHIVTVAKEIKTELTGILKINESKISVINNSFDIQGIQSKSSEPLISEEYEFLSSHEVLITSGRLEKQKNHKFLVELFAEILVKRKSIKLLILGEGSLKNELIMQADSLGLKIGFEILDRNADIYFLGYQSNPFKYIKLAKLFMLTSLWEGFPLALCEALIIGTPVLAFDCPTGPREILTRDSNSIIENDKPQLQSAGVLFPIHDDVKTSIEQWLNITNELLNNRVKLKQMSIQAINVGKSYDKRNIINDWIDLIESI
ncbi:MAG: glycosyltransferase [Fulvivirga sp.]|uniref:glycosyltransferase n=1 Tax=Fulvivirga sp. TaxID=1931237 RepID=UPI0032EB7EDA